MNNRKMIGLIQQKGIKNGFNRAIEKMKFEDWIEEEEEGSYEVRREKRGLFLEKLS